MSEVPDLRNRKSPKRIVAFIVFCGMSLASYVYLFAFTKSGPIRMLIEVFIGDVDYGNSFVLRWAIITAALTTSLGGLAVFALFTGFTYWFCFRYQMKI